MFLRTVLPVVAVLAVVAAYTSPSPATPPVRPGIAPPPPSSPTPAPTPAGPPVKPVPAPSSEPPAEAVPIHEGHKEYRTKHCASWLRWSAQLEGLAQERANSLAESCRVKAPKDNTYGENLWSGTADKFPTKKVVDSWYAEGRRYNYKRAKYSRGTSRFTQMVWKGSKRYGCATATCKKTTFWICLYDPPGNVDGEFAANVKSPSSCKE